MTGNRVGIGVADIAPEEQAAIERRERIVNLLEEIDIDGTVALLFDRLLGAAHAKIEGFVGADMDERRGKFLSDLREPVFDERQSAGLTGREYVAVRSFSEVLVKLPFEYMVQMAEGLLLRNDGDVILAGVGDEFLRLLRGERTLWRSGQRMIGKEQRVLEIGRVDIDFEGREDPNLVLLEIESRKRPAREIVVDTAIAHRRPVAHCAGGQHAWCTGQRQQLLERLHSVEDSRARRADDVGIVRVDDKDVAFRFHGRIEGELVALEDGFGLSRIGAKKRNAIGRLRCGSCVIDPPRARSASWRLPDR